MSIESFDVEPVDHRTLARWVCGVIATASGFLAVIGWPLPMPLTRTGNDHAWERTLTLVQAWLTHDGWRTSGASWFWGGIAIVATSCAIVLHRGGRRPWALVVAPGAAVGALGPLVQVCTGLPWSNYESTPDALGTTVVYVIGLVVAVGLPFLHHWVMRGRDEGDVTGPVGHDWPGRR